MFARPTRSCAAVLALCGAWVAFACDAKEARADEIVPTLSLQTGVTFTRTPGNDTDDYFVAVTPAITYVIEADRLDLALSYSFTGSLNTVLPNAIANRVGVQGAYDITPKTKLLFGVEGLQSLIGNYLLVRSAANTQIGQLPPLNTSLLTLTGTQGISHDISPVTRLSQGLTGTYVTSLDPDTRLNNYLAVATLAIDRAWQFDALGALLELQYSRTFFPPLESNSGTAAIGPTWDRDWTTWLTTSANVAGQMAFSPDPGSKIRLGPSGRASALFYRENSGIEASYVGGIQPNLLLGTLLQSHTAGVRGFTPVSERLGIVFGVSAAYLHAKTLDLQEDGLQDNEFDAILHDADLTWTATDFLSLSVRYQFIGQGAGVGPGATPPLVRHGVVFGAELFGSKPINRKKVQSKFPQRVDRKDGPSLPTRRP